MNVRDFASQFNVFIFSQDANLGAKAKHAVAQAGYPQTFFADIDELFIRVDQEPPHILIFDVVGGLLPLQVVVEKLLKSSRELKFIFLAPPDQIKALRNYRKFNVNHIVDRASVAFDDVVLEAVDTQAELLYRQYQNEQIFDALEEERAKFQGLQATLEHERKSPKIRPYQLRIAQYRTAQSKEKLLDMFYEQTPQQSWVYLRYVSTIQTFVAVSFHQVPVEWVEGLSFKVPTKEKSFMAQILQGELPLSLRQYLKDKMSVEHFKFLPLVIKENVEGVLISTQDISAEVAEDFSLMSLIYSLQVYESQPKYLDIEDSLTGFYNQLFYRRLIEKEVDRAKRAFVPISIIKISIDKFAELEVSQGSVFTEEAIKKVSDLIKQTSRLPDYLCRTDVNEFTLVLSNCNRKGAAIRAERLKQEVRKMTMSKPGLNLTVSQGISEYPTLTSGPDDLDESAFRAMKFIATKGGDKICIYKPQGAHRPDFTVNS